MEEGLYKWTVMSNRYLHKWVNNAQTMISNIKKFPKFSASPYKRLEKNTHEIFDFVFYFFISSFLFIIHNSRTIRTKWTFCILNKWSCTCSFSGLKLRGSQEWQVMATNMFHIRYITSFFSSLRAHAAHTWCMTPLFYFAVLLGFGCYWVIAVALSTWQFHDHEEYTCLMHVKHLSNSWFMLAWTDYDKLC